MDQAQGMKMFLLESQASSAPLRSTQLPQRSKSDFKMKMLCPSVCLQKSVFIKLHIEEPDRNKYACC